jgi:putative nucleotidyltransferase with HDIG domain
MLTRIDKAAIKKGMFVEAVECPDAIFAKRRFVLDEDSDFSAILNSPAEFVTINTAFGTDCAKAMTAASQDGAKAPLSAEEARAAAVATIGRLNTILKPQLIGLVTGSDFDMAGIAPVVQEISQADAATSALFFEVTRLKNKDETTFQHSLSVGILMGKLGDALELDTQTIELLVLAGLLHDVGKLTISTDILQKQGPLTEAERRVIRSHPRRGHTILKKYAGIPDEVLEISLHHHEALDGSGYPSQKAGAEIGQLVRISTVCDVFDALTSVRPYKRGWASADALIWMFEREHQFDRKLVVRLGACIDA